MTQARAQMVFELLYTAYRSSERPDGCQLNQWHVYIGQHSWEYFGTSGPGDAPTLTGFNRGHTNVSPFQPYTLPRHRNNFRIQVVNIRGALNILAVDSTGKLVAALIWRETTSPWWVLVDFEDGTIFGCDRN